MVRWVERVAQDLLGPDPARRSPGEDVQVRHVFVEKRFMKAQNARECLVRLRRSIQDPRAPVLLFCDSECRDEVWFKEAGRGMADLVKVLGVQHTHVHGMVFNPMSEGAWLLFDEALDAVASTIPNWKEPDDLHRLRRDRQRGLWVSKDRVQEVFQLGHHKRTLNDAVTEATFRAGLPDCAHAPYLRVLHDVRALLERAWSLG